MPESSAPYPIGSYGSVSDDPLGPFVGLAVSYQGIDGGSSEFLPGVPPDRNAYLAYRFRLDFSAPVVIDGIVMTGWGDNRPGQSQMRLLDASQQVLSTEPLTGLNVPDTWVLHGNGTVGTPFFYDEFDGSGVVRFRSDLTGNFDPVPEPAVVLLIGAGLGVIVLRRWWVARRQPASTPSEAAKP